MPASSLILVGILTNASGILGSLAWPRIQAHFSWSNKKVLIILVLMCSLIPAYGCLGFLPIFRDGLEGEALARSTKLRVGGLTTPGEMFGLAIYFGTVYGAFQGYARAFYAGLIPPGEEARWYGLYSITDKVRLSAFHTLSTDLPCIIVKLLPWPAARGSHLRPNGQHPFLVLLPCCDGLVCRTYSPRRGA